MQTWSGPEGKQHNTHAHCTSNRDLDLEPKLALTFKDGPDKFSNGVCVAVRCVLVVTSSDVRHPEDDKVGSKAPLWLIYYTLPYSNSSRKPLIRRYLTGSGAILAHMHIF